MGKAATLKGFEPINWSYLSPMSASGQQRPTSALIKSFPFSLLLSLLSASSNETLEGEDSTLTVTNDMHHSLGCQLGVELLLWPHQSYFCRI